MTLIWDMTVVGYEVSYSGRRLLVQCLAPNLKGKENERERERVLAVDNGTRSQKKKIFFGHKSKATHTELHSGLMSLICLYCIDI